MLIPSNQNKTLLEITIKSMKINSNQNIEKPDNRIIDRVSYKTSKINKICVKRRERKAPYNPYPNAVEVARGARHGRLLLKREAGLSTSYL